MWKAEMIKIIIKNYQVKDWVVSLFSILNKNTVGKHLKFSFKNCSFRWTKLMKRLNMPHILIS